MIVRPKLFDANAHPTLDGAWIDGNFLCDFDRMQQDSDRGGLRRGGGGGAAGNVGLQ